MGYYRLDYNLRKKRFDKTVICVIYIKTENCYEVIKNRYNNNKQKG